jgi:hypothetical protein
MKRFVRIACVALFMFLQACNIESNELVDPQAERFSLFGTPGFGAAVRDNPIDQAFEALELGGSTTQIIRDCIKFTAYWNKEIDATIELLQSFLHEDEYEILLSAQQAWHMYMSESYMLMQSLLEIPGGYEIAYGMLDWGLANSNHMQKTRERALEMMEYYFRFTGEVLFVFEGLTA